MLTEYFFVIYFDWISGTSISYTIFIGCLTVRFDLSDYRLTAHVTYGVQSFVHLLSFYVDVSLAMFDNPRLIN